jgi:hypothetical protein
MLGVFALLMAVKLGLLLKHPVPERWSGDSGYYVAKALYLHEQGKFQQILKKKSDPAALEYSDFRPPGYPLFIAALLPLGTTIDVITRSVRLVQFAMDAGVSIMLLLIAWKFSPLGIYRWLATLVVGVQPWTSSYIVAVYPDTLTMFLLVAGVAALAVFVNAKSVIRAGVAIMTASLLLGLTFTVRPEMILFAGLVKAVAFGLRLTRWGWKDTFANGLLAAIPMLLVFGINVGYRWQAAGEVRLFGKFQHATPGLMLWTKTWIGPQTLKERVVWGPLSIGPEGFVRLPDGAFSDNAERLRLTEIVRDVAERGYMLPEEDQVFAAVADHRIEHSPWKYYVWNRVRATAEFWVNWDNAPHYLNGFSQLPRFVSKALTASFMALKLTVLFLCLVGVLRVLNQSLATTRDSWFFCFLLFGIVIVVSRTFYFGAVAVWIEYRYALIAWPFVLALAFYGLSWCINLRAGGELSEAQEDGSAR